jgi:HPt (histidine-containing phosphotransfer) domain-containing protein
MDDFVAKPASIADLAAALARIERADRVDVAVAAPTAPIVDARTLEALGDELGSTAVVRRLVDTFLASLDTRVADIEAGDDGPSQRAAHTLKSGARLLGADRLAHLCAVAEETGHAPGSVREVATETRRWYEQWLSADGRAAAATSEVGAGS